MNTFQVNPNHKKKNTLSSVLEEIVDHPKRSSRSHSSPEKIDVWGFDVWIKGCVDVVWVENDGRGSDSITYSNIHNRSLSHSISKNLQNKQTIGFFWWWWDSWRRWRNIIDDLYTYLCTIGQAFLICFSCLIDWFLSSSSTTKTSSKQFNPIWCMVLM